jgi:polysaccharide pyruvyl transferase CsaB
MSARGRPKRELPGSATARSPLNASGSAPAASAPARGCKVLLGGWYGATNLGDEIVLSTFIEWVREAHGIPSVISVNPAYTKAAFGVNACSYHDLGDVAEAIADADLVVLGGGGLFQDYDRFDRASLARFPAYSVAQFAQYALLARELRVPTAVLAQGVGPLRSADAREITAEIFSQVGVCSVRDAESARLVRDIGVERSVPIAPDVGWSYALPERSADLAALHLPLRGRRVLAVSVRDWPFESGWEDAFLTAFRHALPPGWGCLWIDFARLPSDDPLVVSGSEIADRMIAALDDDRVHVVWRGMALREAASLLAGCDALLAMRYHGVILGHLAGLPVVSLDYDDKLRALNGQLRVPASQHMPLAEIAQRLPAALREVCAPDGAAPRVDIGLRNQLRSSSLAHRDLLWSSMRDALRGPTGRIESTPLLDRWVVDQPGAVERVAAAVAKRRAEQARSIPR